MDLETGAGLTQLLPGATPALRTVGTSRSSLRMSDRSLEMY